jgi:predicted nuclease with RNAse H fold
MVLPRAKRIVVGIDVGGARKGFHAVALVDGTYLDRKQTPSVRELTHWVSEEIGAQIVAIDSPCRWRSGKSGRTAELELLEKGIRCFLTPNRGEAVRNTTGFYHWMLRGAELFRAFEKTHPLCRAGKPTGRKCTFETFPHAITWHLRGGKADATHKRPQRLALLRRHGVSVAALTNMDWIDAAVCALAAEMFAAGHVMRFYGDRRTGHIVVPELSGRACA